MLAFDLSEAKLIRVQENAARLRLGNIACAWGDATEVTLRGVGEFDIVLADVPCSNSAVLARRVEVRHRLKRSPLK